MIGYRLVDSAAGLSEARTSLEKELQEQAEKQPPRLYLDTEFESNRSGTRLCLLQVTAGTTCYLFDALRCPELSALAPSLTQAEWVMHAGLQDVELIARASGVVAPKRLFDTQIAWALLSPEASVSLSYLKYRLLSLRSEKGHQADDWMRRPLQQSQLRYAAADVAELPQMTDLLLAQAASRGRTEIIYAASLDTLRPVYEPPAPLTLSSFRNAWQLSAKSQAALLFLMRWYNALSPDERARAPEAKALLSIASRCPEDVGTLSRIKGVPARVVQRYGKELVEGIRRAEQGARAEDFEELQPPPYATFEEIRVDAWLAQMKATLCVELCCAPEQVLPGRLLKRMKTALLVEGVPGLLDSLVGWRQELLAAALLAFCEETPPPLW